MVFTLPSPKRRLSFSKKITQNLPPIPAKAGTAEVFLELRGKVKIMLSHEVDRTTVEITVATNGIIESKKRLENPVYPQSIKNLLNILANRPGAIEIFRALQKEK